MSHGTKRKSNASGTTDFNIEKKELLLSKYQSCNHDW